MNNRDATRLSLERGLPLLKCYLFGAPQIEWAGQPLRIPRRQTRALLFYLATHLKPVQREKLSFIFWPEVPDRKARRNLSRLLNLLKRSLNHVDVFIQTNDVVGLQTELVWSDVQEFKINSIQRNHQQVLQLYSGTFLEGFALPNCSEFENWMGIEAKTLESTYLDCLETRLHSISEQGHFKEAITLAQSYLQIDNLSEPVHRRLIELYAISGDRAAAFRQYEECSALLRRELGVDTLPDTKSVIEAVLSENPIQIVRRHPVNRSFQTQSEIPFVGRGDTLGKLDQILHEVKSAHGRVVLIRGEAGIGKTHLVQNYLERISRQVTILQSSAGLVTQDLPYQLIAHALRSGLASGAFPDIQDLSLISESSRLIPELGSIYPDLPPLLPLDTEGAQLRLFDALCQFVFGYIKPGIPLLLCFDDLQWADSTSLRWLAYMGQQILSRPVMVIGTCRPEDASKLGEFTLGVSKYGMITELNLKGLELEDVKQAFVSIDFPWASNNEFITRLWRLTAGNPFFIKEIARGLIESERDITTIDMRGKLPLPETILQAVKSRLHQLSEIAKQVLDAASVIGVSFSFELVRETSGRSEWETELALNELVERRLLSEREGVLDFKHEIIQLIVYQTMTIWRKRLLHKRAARALSKFEPHSHARLSWHFEMAESLQQAAAEAIQAGVSVKQIFAYKEALNHFNLAIDLLQKDSQILQHLTDQSSNWRLRIKALAERGWVFRHLGDMQAYEKDLQQEALLVEKLGDVSARVHLHQREAALQRWWCRYDRALESAEKGLLLNQVVGDVRMEARCLREKGLAYREKGEFSQAQASLEQALQLYEGLNDPVLLIHTLGNLSTLFVHQADFDRAMLFAKRALEICDRQDLAFERRLPLGDCGVAAVGLGDIQNAREWLTESLDIARQIDDRTQEIFCLGHLGWIALRQEQISPALECLTAAYNLAETINSCAEQSRLYIGLAEANWMAGNSYKASDYARKALLMAKSQNREFELRAAQKLLKQINSCLD